MSADPTSAGGTTSESWSVPREAVEAFSLARMAIQLYWPFLTAAAFRLVPRWSPLVPTLAVDRYWRLYMNPQFVLEQSTPVLALLIAGHELQHALMGHSDRLTEHRDKTLVVNGTPRCFANICHDLAINSGLHEFAASGVRYRTEVAGKECGTLKAPENLMYPKNFVDKQLRTFPNGLVSEGYAELFLNNASTVSFRGSGAGSSKCASGQCGSGAGSKPEPWEDPSGADPEKPESGVSSDEQDILRQHTAQAAKDQAEKHRGTVPGEMALWAEAHLTPPKVDWRKKLSSAVRRGYNRVAGQVDHSFAKPNRRAVASQSKVILPGMFAVTPVFGVAFDTSGSMGPSDYDMVFSEIRGILRSCGLRKVPVLACDAKAYGIQMVSSIEEIEMTGGGGTDMGAAIRGALEIPKIGLIIVLTDSLTTWPDKPPDTVKVIIVITQPVTQEYPLPDWAEVVEAYDE